MDISTANGEKDEAVVVGSKIVVGKNIQEEEEENEVTTTSDADSGGCKMSDDDKKDLPNSIFEDDGDGYFVEEATKNGKNEDHGKGADGRNGYLIYLTYAERIITQKKGLN